MKGFFRAGHLPTLVAALLYFDVSFMVWVLLGPLAPFLSEDLGLTASQQGLLTAIPLLGGSLFRPLLGMLADRIGARRTGMLGLVLTLVPLTVGWQYAHTAAHFYTLGFFLGIAGASFAVALPLASLWYPPETMVVLELGTRWSQRWERRAVRQAGIYSYRSALFGMDGERAV